MKYFKITNTKDTEEEFYVSSTLENETPTHLALTLHLGAGDDQYQIVEVTKEEFDRETEEDVPEGLRLCRPDIDLDTDDDWEDLDDEYVD